MTNDDDDQPITRQAIAARNRSAPGKVTGRLHAAIMEMVWKGSCRAEAAQAAQMTDHSLREALRRPHVRAFYLAELGILRTSERAKTFHRLCVLRDQDENRNAAVAAARLLEALYAEAASNPISTMRPGVTIVIQQPTGAPPPTVAARPVVTIEGPRRDGRGDPIFDPYPGRDEPEDDIPPHHGGNNGRE
jgi:hypothetical protein